MKRIFDTETTGANTREDRIVQIAWIDFDLPDENKYDWRKQSNFKDTKFSDDGFDVVSRSMIVNPGIPIPKGASEIHGITDEIAQKEGVRLDVALHRFFNSSFDTLIAHNLGFDYRILENNIRRCNEIGGNMKRRRIDILRGVKRVCTMKSTSNLLKLPHKNKKKKKYQDVNNKYKWPNLQELHEFLFDEEFEDAHDALADCRATFRCYKKLQADHGDEITWRGII